MIFKEKNRNVLELDMQRNVVGGSSEALRTAIKNAADLRIYTEFKHNEHIDTSSDNTEIIREVSDFPATYLIDDRWVGAMMTLRQPVVLPDRFGARASMSLFMYNEDGRQACARLLLDEKGEIPTGDCRPPEMFNGGGTPKPMIHYHEFDVIDKDTNCPSSNFVYDFYSYKYLVDDAWTEVLSHDADGNVLSGSAKLLDEASNAGCELKMGIQGICDGLYGEEENLKHELFIQTGPHYYYSETGFMVAETRPFVRVKPEIPMTYKSHNWDYGWAIVRSDGHVAGLFYAPYTLKTRRIYTKKAMRWFVKNK